MIKIEKHKNKQEDLKEEPTKRGLNIEFNFKKKGPSFSKDLKTVLNQSRLILFLAILFLLLSAVLEVSLMLKLKDITDLAFTGNVGEVKNIIYKVLLVLLFLIPNLIINSKLQAFYMEKSMVNLKKHYLRVAFANRGGAKTSQYISSLTNNLAIVQTKYFGSRYNFYSGFIYLIAGVFLAVVVDWKIIIFSLAISLIILLGVFGMSNTITGILNRLTNSHAGYTQRLREALTGMNIIKTNSLEDKIKDEFTRDSMKIQAEQAAFQKDQLNINAFMQLLVSLFLFGFLIVIIRFVWNGNYTAGEVVYLLTSFSFVLVPGLGLFMNAPDLTAGKESLLNLETMFKSAELIDGTEDFKASSELIKIKDLSFAYDEEEIIKDFNVDLELGKKYLIVGPSGVGKSTFIKLLQRELNPTSGDIFFDNLSLKDIKMDSLLQEIAYLGQDIFLFEDTIENNISLSQISQGFPKALLCLTRNGF